MVTILRTQQVTFVVILGNNPTTALISMKATQLKVSRKWNSMMMGLKMQGKNGMFTPPTYSHIYKLKTVQQSNDKGTWFGWDVSRVGPIEDAGIYKIAKDFGANVSKGEVNVKHGEQESNPIHRTKDFHWKDLEAGDGRLDPASQNNYGKI